MRITRITKQRLGAELLICLEDGYTPEEIENWANTYFHKHIQSLDPEVRLVLEDLMSMSMGPEFEMNLTEIKDLAIRMIKNGIRDGQQLK